MTAVLQIARLQILENVRKQVHLVTLFLAVILLMLPAYINAFSLGTQGFERVAKDLGLTLIGYYGLAMALFHACTVVARDIERKTIYPILSKPVTRLAYLSGQFLGVAVLIVVSLLVLCTCLMLAVAALSQQLDPRLYLAVLGNVLESVVLAAVCMCLAVKASPALAGVAGVFIYAVGGLSDNFIRFFIEEDRGDAGLASLARGLRALMPNFEVFRLKMPVVHNLNLPEGYVPAIVAYAIAWVVLSMLLANLLFERKDL